MDKHYLEFLEELVYSLREYENSFWSDWMQKSSLLFHCFSSITTELITITYEIATSLRDNRQDSILSIMDKEQKR